MSRSASESARPSDGSPTQAGEPAPTKRSVARRAIVRARQLARLSALPDDPQQSRGVLYLTLALRGGKRLVRRLQEDRIQPRAAGLAFHTLLAIVPIAAVTFALLDFFDVLARRAVIASVVERYFPSATSDVVDAVYALVAEVNFETVGLIGFVTLLPITIALVTQVEVAMTDIFRTRRPKRIRRLFAYALLVIFAPVGAVLTVQYTPELDVVSELDRLVGPIVITFVIFYLAFRYLPGARIRNLAAVVGAALGAVALSIAKFAFGIWATDFATGTHVVWGAVAFVPAEAFKIAAAVGVVRSDQIAAE